RKHDRFVHKVGTTMRYIARRTMLACISAAAALTAFGIGAGLSPAGAAPTEATTQADGTIASVARSNLTIATESGQKVVKLAPETLVLSRQTATLGAIKPGDPMAVTSKRETDGSLTAVSINIFSPELWDRVRKGQWVMDSGNIMTNAIVMQYAER